MVPARRAGILRLMLVPAKRLLAVLALGLLTVGVSACCGGKSTNIGATAKCKNTAISSVNCKNCCNAYGSTSYSYLGRNSCTCR